MLARKALSALSFFTIASTSKGAGGTGFGLGFTSKGLGAF